MKIRLQKKSISKMILHFRKQLKILRLWVKKSGSVSLKEIFLVWRYDFPGLPTTLNTFEVWSNGGITEELGYSAPLLQKPHTSGRGVLPSKLVEGRWWVQTLAALIDLNPRMPRSHMWTIGLKTYNPTQPNPLLQKSYLHSPVLREYRRPATGLPRLSKSYSI